MEKRVLLIDDDPHFIQRLQITLGNTVDLRVASVADEAIQVCAVWQPDLILLDVHLAPGDSFSILDEISVCMDDGGVSVLCLSRGAGSTTRLQSFGDAVFGILKRELGDDDLRATIARALDGSGLVAA